MISQYMEAFANKDLGALTEMFSDNVTLQDPFVGKVQGKEHVLNICKDIFEGNSLELTLGRTFHSDTGSKAQEFVLLLRNDEHKETRIEGIDCFTFQNGKISAIRAYVEECKSDVP